METVQFSVRTPNGLRREFVSLDEAMEYARSLVDDGHPAQVRRMSTGRIVVPEADLSGAAKPRA